MVVAPVDGGHDIKRLACQQYINKFAGTYIRSVLTHIRATLLRVLEAAVDWGWIDDNSARRLKLPKGRDAVQATVLKPDQLVKVMAALRSN